MVIRFDTSPYMMTSSRMLTASQARFGTAAARLGSGLRVNSGADDAAGLQLASKLQARVTGWQQAQRNIQDGLSVANVAEGAFSTLGGLIGRIRELAIQSANGVYTDIERQALQDEVVALREQVFQVVEGTKFNGIALLKGSEYRPPPTIDVSLLAGGVAAYSYGTDKTETGTYQVVVQQPPTKAQVFGSVPAVTLPAGAPNPAIQLSVTGALGTATVDLAHGSAPATWVGLINGQSATTGVEATLQVIAGDNYLVLSSTGAGGSQTVRARALAQNPMVSPEDYIGFGPGVILDQGDDMVATINGVNAKVGGSATVTTLTVNAGGNPASGLTVGITNPPPAGYLSGPFPYVAGTVDVTAFAIEIVDLDLQIHSGPNQPNQQPLTIKPMIVGTLAATGANTLGTIDISTQAGAQAAIDVTDAAVTQIAEARSVLAADVNTLEQALKTAQTGEYEQEGANSRIVDADAAAEAAEMARAQIQTETASAAASHINTDAARALQLITDSRVGVLITPAERGSSIASEAPADASTASSASTASANPGGGIASSGSSFSSPSAMADLGGYGAMPVTPGFTAQAVTPGFTSSAITPGYVALPVLGSGGNASGASGLSTGQIFSMIQGSLL